MKLTDIVNKGIIWCPARDSTREAARLMETKQVRRLPVLDENKRMVGILSLEDISHATSQRAGTEVMTAVSSHHAGKR